MLICGATAGANNYQRNRMNHTKELANKITAWIKNYADQHDIKSLVVGVSGGIDSAVVSTLCARTGLPTVVMTLPIRQRPDLHQLSSDHAGWLLDNFDNVKHINLDLTIVFDAFESSTKTHCVDQAGDVDLAFANSRSRLRMMTLYQTAQSHGGIVVGTGNRVEDFGVGFFTKYGDGGVDISPIGDLLKTEVWALGRELGVLEGIIDAPPTDGLWDDGRCDQDQLEGLSYAELELAMSQDESGEQPVDIKELAALTQYRRIRRRNLHKMLPIPVFKKSGS
jgi:NAD+ synthase